jgi:hypothetical protein
MTCIGFARRGWLELPRYPYAVVVLTCVALSGPPQLRRIDESAGLSMRGTSMVTELEEVPDVDRRRVGHSPEAAHVRLRRGGDGPVGARPDRAGGSGASGRLAVPLRRDERGGVRAGGLHRVAVRRRGTAPGACRAAPGRAGRHLRAARTQAAGEDRQGRREAAAGVAGCWAVAGVLYPALAGVGVAGAAGSSTTICAPSTPAGPSASTRPASTRAPQHSARPA